MASAGDARRVELTRAQNCIAGSRAFVASSIYDDFVDLLAAKAAQRVVGDPFDEDAEQGAIVGRPLRARALGGRS